MLICHLFIFFSKKKISIFCLHLFTCFFFFKSGCLSSAHRISQLTYCVVGALCITRPSSDSSVQFSRSVVSDSLWPHESQHARPPCPSQTPGVYSNSQSLLKLMSIKSVMPSSHLILCHPLLLLPPIPPSIRVFSDESTLHMRWPNYWSFSFSISPSNEHPGLISFRMD